MAREVSSWIRVRVKPTADVRLAKDPERSDDQTRTVVPETEKEDEFPVDLDDVRPTLVYVPIYQCLCLRYPSRTISTEWITESISTHLYRPRPPPPALALALVHPSYRMNKNMGPEPETPETCVPGAKFKARDYVAAMTHRYPQLKLRVVYVASLQGESIIQ